MASDIQTTATMSVANMKVSPGDQADAIWAQNLADNTGYLFTRPTPFINGIGTSGTTITSSGNPFGLNHRFETYFFRSPGHNKLMGTYSASGTFDSAGAPDCYRSDGFTIQGDLGAANYFQAATVANIGANLTWGSTYRFTQDLGGIVSEGQWGTFIGTFWGTSADDASSRFITYRQAVPTICHTTWG